MPVVYHRARSAFVHGLDVEQFTRRVNTSTHIGPTCFSVVNFGDDVRLTFATVLTADEEVALDTLALSRVPPTLSRAYDAIVDARGRGDYQTMSAAFDAGHRSVFVRNGVYVERRDVRVPPGGTLRGESSGGVIISCVGACGVVCDATNGRYESGGTVSCATSTAVVHGQGTVFSRLSPGEFILLGTQFVGIAEVVDDTTLRLACTYHGTALVGTRYLAQTMLTGVTVSDIVITNSTGIGLYCRGLRHSLVTRVGLKKNARNAVVVDSGNLALSHLLSDTSQGSGIVLENCVSTSLSVVNLVNNLSHGLVVGGGCVSIVLDTCNTSNNRASGIVVTDAQDVTITNCSSRHNRGDGVVLHQSVRESVVHNSSIANNQGNGVIVAGYYHRVSNNLLANNGAIGLDLRGDRCTIGHNMLVGNTSGGVVVGGKDNVVSANVCSEHQDHGLRAATGSRTNLLVHNNVKGNAVIGLLEEGLDNETHVNLI